MSALFTALGVALFVLAFIVLPLRVIYLMCDGRRAMKAQVAEMPADYSFKPNPDDIIHTEHGMFRVSDGEYVPFERAA